MAHYATGSGTWDATNLAIWFMDAARTIPATTVPTSVDDVVFDASTGSITCDNTTYSLGGFCRNFTGTKPHASGYVSVYGDCTVDSGTTTSRGFIWYGNVTLTGVYYCEFSSFFGGGVNQNLVTNGYNITCSAYLRVLNGSVVNLTENLSVIGDVRIQNTGSRLNTNGYTLNISRTLFVDSGCIINGGTSTINIGTTTTSGTDTSISSISILSVATVNITARQEFAINCAVGTLNVTGLSTTTILGTCSFGTPTNCNITSLRCTIAANQTFTNLTLQGTQTNRTLLTSTVEFTRRTLTVNGTLSVSNTILRNITGAGTASWDLSAGTDIGDGGYNSGITFPASRDTYWVGVSGGNWNDTTNWSLNSGGSSGIVPLPQDIHKFDANSITSSSSSITVGQYLIAGEIQSAGLLNTPTLVTTALNVIFLKSIDVSGFGTLNSNKIWYVYNESDVSIKGIGTQTIYDLRTYQTINSDFKVSLKSNFALTSLYGRNTIDCEGNIITVATYYNISATATLNINAGGKLIITTAGRLSYQLTQNGDGCVELGGSGSPYLDVNTSVSSSISHTINRLCINCTGTADIKRSNASTFTTTYNINKLTFAQANKALTFYGEGGANGNVRLVIGEVVVASGNTLQSTNGQGSVSITTANKNFSKVLDFGNCNLTNIAAQERNTVYTTGTVTNCTQVYNQVPFMVGRKFAGGRLVRSQISKINGINFNALK